MAQITTQMSRGPTLQVVSGDYTGIPLSLRRRLSLRLINDGIDVTPKPLLYDTEELSEYIQEGIQPSAATHHTSDIHGTTSSSLHVTKSTPVELTSTQEPVTQSEMKHFVLLDDSKTSEVSGEIPQLPSNPLYHFHPQEPKVPEPSLPPRNILITLKETPTIFHLTLPALNLDVETEESEAVESDNKYYEYVTIGKGRHRNTKTAEVQTEYSFRKTRSTMTTAVEIEDSSASANAWDLYHSYRKLENISVDI
jgi:hypothetical protein